MSFNFGKSDDDSSKESLSGGFQMTASTKDDSKEVYIGNGTTIEGKFTFEGPAVINCKIVGDIEAKGAITVGSLGEVQGNITGAEVIICGKVNGDIEAGNKIYLSKPGCVQGNLKAPKISIDDGVVFNGNCSMKSPGEIVDLKREATV